MRENVTLSSWYDEHYFMMKSLEEQIILNCKRLRQISE